jgi:hypothetical protein
MPETSAQIVFQRQSEPNESAFSVLVPLGWQIVGGITRANLMQEQISAQNMEPRLDFAVLQDAAGSTMVRWGPTVKYCDMRYNPVGQMGMFPPGSNYMGMIVCPLMPAAQFLGNVAFPWAHPRATQVQLLETQPLPEKMTTAQQRAAAGGLPFSYDAAAITYTYQEGGVAYKEKSLALIENLGQIAAGIWSNRETAYLRAPQAEFERWLPLLGTIYRSFRINPAWMQQEEQRQGYLGQMLLQRQHAEQYRAQKALETQRYIQNVNQQIVEHRQRTNAEIRNDQYLFLTGQEEYVNPYTHEIDTSSNEWNYRWVTPAGQEFYSDNESDNPNDANGVLNRQDWKRTPVRKRFPE